MRHLLGTVLVAATLWSAGPCLAQVGGMPSDVMSAKQALTAEQRKKLDDAVGALTRKFETGSPTEVVEARNAMIDVVRNPLGGDVFHREYAAALVKRFQPMAGPKTSFQATNAFIVARFLGSVDAVDFLVANIDPDEQSDDSLRIAAAAQLSKAIAGAPLSGPQLDALAKRIVSAAKDEKSWIALSHELDAVGDMLRQKTLPAAQAESIAQSEAAIINDLSERFAKGGNPELVQALQRGMLLVRNQLTSVPEPGRSKLLTSIAPSIQRVTGMKGQAPAPVASRKDLASSFSGLSNTATLLQKVASGGAPIG